MRQPILIVPSLFFALLLSGIASGQADITWTGGGDGSTFSDDANWNPSVGTQGPEFAFPDDSLKFDSAGSTITNDLDPASNGGAPLQLGPGTGAEADSAAFHFLAGSGDFTVDGFAVQAGSVENDGVFRADAGAGMLQTFNLPITFTGGQKRRKVALNNNGTVVFNGDINYTNSILFIDEGAGRVEINGNNTGVGPNVLTAASGNNGTNASRAVVRNNVANSVISLGSDGALGDPGTGTWDAGDLQLRGMTANQITFIETDAPRDFSNHYIQLSTSSGGGAARVNTPHDMSIGYIYRAGNGTRVFSVENTGVLTVEQGLVATTDLTPRTTALFTGGTNGNAAGGNGEMVVNGRLITAMIDPASAAAQGNSATAGIDPNATPLIAVDGVTPVNGGFSLRFGTFRLNGDSSSSWIGSQVVAQGGSTVYLGNDNALGDSNSLVGVIQGATLDIGTHTIEQRFARTDGGTVRGNGTLTNEADWSYEGILQPGGASPVTSDTLTFDFSGAAVANTLQFEANSTVDFVLGAGLTSSTVDVVGSPGGGTTVAFADNTFNFTDQTAGSLALGDYTLFDGDANTSFTLGGAVALNGLGSFGGSLSIVGDDLILTVTAMSTGNGDFDGNGLYECDDVDALVADIASMSNTPSFDLTGDGMVNNDDLLSWLDEAGEANLGPGQSFLVGDANLDGVVDVSDFNVWNSNKFSSNPAWCAADFNADGVVDVSDFNLWNSNKFQSSDVSAVPEPGGLSLILLGLCCLVRRRRECVA